MKCTEAHFTHSLEKKGESVDVRKFKNHYITRKELNAETFDSKSLKREPSSLVTLCDRSIVKADVCEMRVKIWVMIWTFKGFFNIFVKKARTPIDISPRLARTWVACTWHIGMV